MAERGWRSQGMLGNQLSKTLTIKTPLYMSSHFPSPAATTVSGVFRAPLALGRSRRDAKNKAPIVDTLLLLLLMLMFNTGMAAFFISNTASPISVVTVRVLPRRMSPSLSILHFSLSEVGLCAEGRARDLVKARGLKLKEVGLTKGSAEMEL